MMDKAAVLAQSPVINDPQSTHYNTLLSSQRFFETTHCCVFLSPFCEWNCNCDRAEAVIVASLSRKWQTAASS
jgi:hypothetical protein